MASISLLLLYVYRLFFKELLLIYSNYIFWKEVQLLVPIKNLNAFNVRIVFNKSLSIFKGAKLNGFSYVQLR